MKAPMTKLGLLPALAIPAILFAALALASLHTGRATVSAAGAAPVFVTNTGAAEAIPTAAQGTTPISGAVSITGTPSVSIANSPTVALASGSTVQISNTTPLPIRDLDRPTAQPFNYRAHLTWVSGFAFANADGSQNFVVPDGKRLVIEFVSLQIGVPPTRNVTFARLDSTIGMVLTLTHAGTDFQNNEIFAATHRVFTILEPGTRVVPTAFCVGGDCTSTSATGMFVSVSGYLVDVV